MRQSFEFHVSRLAQILRKTSLFAWWFMASRESRGAGRRQRKKKIGSTLAGVRTEYSPHRSVHFTPGHGVGERHTAVPRELQGEAMPQPESGRRVLVPPLHQIHHGVLGTCLHHASIPSSVRKRTSSLAQSRLCPRKLLSLQLPGPYPRWDLRTGIFVRADPDSMRWGYVCSLSALLRLISTNCHTLALTSVGMPSR